MSFLASFFNSSSARNESSNEAEFGQELGERNLDNSEDPSKNRQTQMDSSSIRGAEKDVSGSVQSPQFLATQSEPSNYVHFQDDNSPSMPRENAVDEAAARSVPMPSRNTFQGSRMRSLSKVFTSLPDKPLPSFAQMVVDQIEFLMHVILLETDPNRASEHQKKLLQAVDVFQNYVPNGKALMKSGRLYSRMMITSLACDIIALSSKASEAENVLEASELPAEGWKAIKERLASLKNLLLKQNSNAAVNFQGDAAISPDAVDEQLAYHEMMTLDFDELTLLLVVHEEIAHFKEKLEGCITEEEQESASLDTSQKSINKAVETCVNSFMKNLSVIFPADEVSPEDEVDDGIEIEEELDENWGRTISNIPKELHALALTELYSPKLQPQATSLVDRLLVDIHSITTENQSSALSLPGRFSFDSLLSKARSLLTKWSETVLEIPTLVQLGYGGVPSPFVLKDDDDVSSWGSEGENAVNADEKIVRSRSFSRILRASIQGRPVSVTAEEKEVIARLASITESFSRPPSDISTMKDIAKKVDALLPPRYVNQQADLSTKPSVCATSSYHVVTSNEASLDVSASSKQNMNPRDTDQIDDFTALDHLNGPLPSSIRGGRKVLKAGRRFLSSLSEMAQKMSDNADENACRFGKKRTAHDTEPATVSRRNNVWAFKQRKKMRLNEIDITREDICEGTHTPKKTASTNAVIVEDDEGNVGRSLLFGSPSSIKRNPFSEDEVNAILEGVKLHGVGHWTAIQESDERLAKRKPGQLKDKYRTMINRGEV